MNLVCNTIIKSDKVCKFRSNFVNKITSVSLRDFLLLKKLLSHSLIIHCLTFYSSI